jgi:hypothetical protein
MTEEVKKLVESVETNKFCKGRTEEGVFLEYEYVRKSDFDHIVEELTKWNKVEDILPESGKKILVKNRIGHIGFAIREEHKFVDPEDGFLLVNIIEWKYIN